MKETTQEWQERERKGFVNQTHNYFDSVKDFSVHMDSFSADGLLTQLHWIENGTYGAGVCVELKRIWELINAKGSRIRNKNAYIGGVLLHAMYGKRFSYWAKLSSVTQSNINAAVSAWMRDEKNFPID